MVSITQNTEHTKSKSTVLFEKLICGGTAGSVAKTAVAPLERVKILFQVRSPNYPYTGVPGTLFRIVQREGFLALYYGNLSSVIRIFPYAAIQFVSFDIYKKLLAPDNGISLLANFTAGALAGATSVVFTYPLDVARARLAVQLSSSELRQYRGLYDALKSMYVKEGGVPALYRGAGPTMLGILPYAGFNFFTYDTLKWYYINKWSNNETIPTHIRLVFGSCAGVIGQTIVYPLDVIRRRMQIDGIALAKDNMFDYKYKSSWSAGKEILQKEGWKLLFRGLHINYIKVIPLVSVSFVVNDLLRSKFGLAGVGE